MLGAAGLKSSQRLDPVEPRHLEIEQHDIRRMSLERGQRLFAAFSERHIASFRSENRL